MSKSPFIHLLCCAFSNLLFLPHQFTCLTAVPAFTGPADDVDDVNVHAPHAGPAPLAPDGPGPDPGLSHLPTPRHRSGPALVLRLFVAENYEQRRIGPCVVTADHRVYVEVWVRVCRILPVCVSHLDECHQHTHSYSKQTAGSVSPGLLLTASHRSCRQLVS